MIQSGTHLVIIDDSSCDTTNAEQLSDPVILNYYRQFFIKVDRKFDIEQEGLKRKIYEAVSRNGINLGDGMVKKNLLCRDWTFFRFNFWYGSCNLSLRDDFNGV